jgi:nucleotide-binding universal stress UspA family protein
VYFGWGLLVAITSVFVAQRTERRYGLVAVLGVALGGVSLDLLAGGVPHASVAGLVVVVVVSGGLLGIVNTVLTEAVMAAAVVERPVASSAYSFVRFTGGAIAPWVAGKLGEQVSAPAPMYLGAVMVALSVVALVLSRGHLRHRVPAPAATAIVLVAIDGTPAARSVVETARVARARGAGVHVLHVRETRSAGDGARAARTLVDAAVGTLRRAGVVPAGGEVVHITGDHADAVLDAAERLSPTALVVGSGDPSVASVLTERSPCDVVVVVPPARVREPVAA